MDQMEAAYRELDRIQEIISRHEGHIFSLRGWMLTVMGGLLAAYYTGNIHLQLWIVQLALPAIALLFLFLESRHMNLIESVVERAGTVEQQLREAKLSAGRKLRYDGPRIGESCQVGAKRILPRLQMTLLLNSAFYIIVILISLVVAIGLPAR